jgi:signal transduction histidine kinase
MTWLRRRGVLFRVILNGIILLILSAAGFLGLASLLVGGQGRQLERTMNDWIATVSCDAYAKTQSRSAFAGYPVRVTIYSREGAPLTSSTGDAVDSPVASELARARTEKATTRSPSGDLLRACPDGSGRYVAVGHPLPKPALGRLIGHLSLSVAAIVLIVALSSIPLARSLIKPLRALVATAIRFGEGDLAARARHETSDEIGDLARAFNGMAAKLEARILVEREMLANISHELRTPLARLRVVLELANEDPARASSLLNEISRDLMELERLTEDVLATVRLDFERGDSRAPAGLLLRAAEIDLAAVLRQAVTRAVEAHPGREFVLDAPKRLPALRGDPVLLRRLFDNLLDNAQKYSTGPIEVRIREEGQTLVVDVEDSGIGIDRADLERVFEPFFRTDRSRQRLTGGTGLGLALCRRIVELHRASIKAESGAGKTTVSVRLVRHAPA